LPDIQGFKVAEMPEPANIVVLPTQVVNTPEMVDNAVMITVLEIEQPREFVYVIVEVPDETPVIKPAEDIVATAIFELIHGFKAAAVLEPVNDVVAPTQAESVPVIVGEALIVILEVVKHPFEFVYEIVDVPAVTPVTTPLGDTVATAVLDEVQGLVIAAVPEPVNVVVAPVQAESVPAIVGLAFIVTTTETIQLFEFV
jgi:hypothetical protein